MTQSWEWSLREALGVIFATYRDDWGRADKRRADFFFQTNVQEIQDNNITGLMTGEGQAVVFIHGSPANAMRWAQYLEDVPDGYQFISIDRRGFGNRKHQQVNVEQDYEELKAYVQTLDNPIIVGHSLGGALAVRLASTLPIKGLVLVASSIDPNLERVLGVQKIGNHPLVRWILSRSVKNSNAEMLQLPKFMFETEKYLNKVSASIYIVHAVDDKLVPIENVAYAQKHFKNMTVSSPDVAGHFVPWTHPELVMNAIKSFDEDLEQVA